MDINGFANAGVTAFSYLSTPGKNALDKSVAPPSGLTLFPRPNPGDLVKGALVITSQKVPTADVDTATAGLRMQDTINFLIDRFQVEPLPVSGNLKGKGAFLDLQLESLGRLRGSLQNVQTQAQDLLRPDALSVRQATSTRPESVTAVASGKSPPGAFSVTPARAAVNNELVSSVQAAPNQALGLSGSFVINGYKVTVAASDAIANIRDKINYGEDANKNGKLDLAEDVNGNGSADVLSLAPREFNGGVYIVEDRNGDGVLAASEDANGDKALDGGAQNIQVRARINGSRLILASTAGGGRGIGLEDTDNILLALGFFERDSKGNPIQKEQDYDFTANPPKNLVVKQQKSTLIVDNAVLRGETDTFTNAIRDTRVDIRRQSDTAATVNIATGVDKAFNRINNFFAGFNAAVTQLNTALSDFQIFENDQQVQGLRADLVNGTEDGIAAIGERNRRIDVVRAQRENQGALGLRIVGAEKRVAQEVAVTRAAEAAGQRLALSSNLGRDLLRRMTAIGIRAETDNTVSVDEGELKRALAINTREVQAVLIDPAQGLLPRLDKELTRILDRDAGDLELKRQKILARSGMPVAEQKSFQRKIENFTLRDKAQNLIAVV